jgi:cytochrome c oxidase subunit IV
VAERGRTDVSESREEEERILHAGAGRYVAVYVALVLLTILTFGLHEVHLGRWSLLIALAIASAKSALVALFFMHLWDQRGANRLVFLVSIVFVALLIGLTVADNATRNPLTNPPGEIAPFGPLEGPERAEPAQDTGQNRPGPAQ